MRKEFALLFGLVLALSLVSGIIFAVELPLSVVINDGAEYTNSATVSLNVSYGNSSSGINVTACKFTNVSSSSEAFNSKEWSDCLQNNSKTDFTFSGAKHGQILEVWFSIKDLDETKTIWSASDTIILDKVYPLLNISRIEGTDKNGKTRTDRIADTEVKLFLDYSDATSLINENGCSFGNDGTIWSEETICSKNGMNWNLSSGDDKKTVWFKIKDKAGNENTTSASIILDTTPPMRSNWMPIGTVDPEPVLSFFTNEWAECKYSTAGDSEFSEMTSKFDSQNITKTNFYFSKKLNGLEKGPHFYYIKCKDELGNINKDNLIISFNADPQARTSPRILETSPKDKSINIPAETKIKIIFSESVNETSARNAFNITPYVDGSFEYTGDVLTFVPSALVYRTEYTVTLNENITDLTGVKMGKTYSFSFTTESRCGNNKIDSGEVCDGGFINITNTTNLNCTSYNSSYVGGLLKCGSNCTFDTGGCILPVCGDGKIETYEECEISNMTDSCLSKGYDSGKLNCVNCRLDYSSCSKITKECEAGKTEEGNWGACAGGEQTRIVKECKNKKWVSKTETKDCIEITQGDAQNAINDAQDAINAAKQQKINTTAAEQKLTEANNALSSGDFENSIKLASDVVGLLEQKGYVKEELPWFLIGGIILVSAIIIAVIFLVIKGRAGRIETEKVDENKEAKEEEFKDKIEEDIGIEKTDDEDLKKEILSDTSEEETEKNEEELKDQMEEDMGADKFENDSSEVEKLEAKKSKKEAITPELMEYINDEVGRGFSKTEITKALKEAGYTDGEISVAESVIKKKLKERNE